MKQCIPVPQLFPIAIPTDNSFLKQWYPWTAGKVSRHFKRDKERGQDTTQNVRLRLLTKKFISRWFYKHLTDELVDRRQAEKVLGGVFEHRGLKNPVLSYTGAIQPVYGHRSSLAGYGKDEHEKPIGDEKPNDTSIWRISDLLNFAKFDYDRYFYSIQNHTIDSVKVLSLLGYDLNAFGSLESLYRQGKLKPSELTDHICKEILRPIPKRGKLCGMPGCKNRHFSLGYCSHHYPISRVRVCPECEHGREILRNRGLSLAERWDRPQVLSVVQKLRWNDTQLKPYLRAWRHQNLIKAVPDYIMRTNPKMGIDAGLLKYAEMVIDHEVVNDFKRISRSDDLSIMVLKNPLSPEYSNDEVIAYDSEDKNMDKNDFNAIQSIVRDSHALTKYSQVEGMNDVQRLIDSADLTAEEMDVIESIDLEDMSVHQFSEEHNIPIPRVHRILQAGHRKLLAKDFPKSATDGIAERVARKHQCTVSDIIGPKMFGACVVARTELFATLFDMGVPITGIASRFNTTEDRVSAAINRSLRQANAC